MQLIIPKETLTDDYEEGYNLGFDDGFEIAMLMEGDEREVVEMCLEACNKLRAAKGCVSNEELAEYVRMKYRRLMEARKSGISMLFDEVLDDMKGGD